MIHIYIYILLHRKISPEILPSCSPGIFRQRSFMTVTATPAPSTQVKTIGEAFYTAPVQCDRIPASSQTLEQIFSRTRVFSRGSRNSSKHSRFGTALANKMASGSSTTIVQGWPNTKDDYELKEVIGKYIHFCQYCIILIGH